MPWGAKRSGCASAWPGAASWSAPLLRPRADGRWMHLYEISTPSGCLVMARLDVTELVQKSEALERSNELLEQLSATDALTGLANRRQFDQRLYAEWQRSMRSQQPLSLLLIDIDHFKRYNDHYGHLAGDACLRQVAGILYDCAQRAGELVARYGGEEFALLLPGADSAAATSVAQRCMESTGPGPHRACRFAGGRLPDLQHRRGHGGGQPGAGAREPGAHAPTRRCTASRAAGGRSTASPPARPENLRINLLRSPHAALGGARNPHVPQVRSGSCAPSALPKGCSLRFLRKFCIHALRC